MRPPEIDEFDNRTPGLIALHCHIPAVQFWRLDEDDEDLVIELLVQALGPIVSAMWSISGPMPMEILESRLAKFPLEEVWLTVKLLNRASRDGRETLIRTVAMLYKIGMEEIKARRREPG